MSAKFAKPVVDIDRQLYYRTMTEAVYAAGKTKTSFLSGPLNRSKTGVMKFCGSRHRLATEAERQAEAYIYQPADAPVAKRRSAKEASGQ